jgi:nitroimidazol reductase NimA-like FMN-containing flavoprotein (pyridoxamine 5'-phosphate oxidase superfamily)
MTTSLTPEANESGGDLSRRVARRRAELGLSLEEVGKDAGIDPVYLNYLEHHADARLSGGSLILLSMALKTTPETLLGGRPPLRRDRGVSGPHPQVEPLSREQCEVHLDAAEYGRVVYGVARGPVAIPVNYEYTDGQIVISTDPEKAAWLEGQRIVGFEVDRVEDGLSEGWSVLVTGEVRSVEDPDEHQRLSSLGLDSWGDVGEHTLVAIKPNEITGRVIVHDTPWE